MKLCYYFVSHGYDCYWNIVPNGILLTEGVHEVDGVLIAVLRIRGTARKYSF